MTFSRRDIALFFSMPLDTQDLSNLNRSGATRVVVPFTMADPTLCAHMAATGHRLILRLTEQDYYTDAAAQIIASQLQAKKAICPIDALIIGCEPENGLDFTYGNHTWDELRAWHHARYLGRVVSACKGLGVPLYTPGWSQRGISEDEPPQPGAISWREIVEPTYQLCAGACAHVYGYAWRSDVDRQRVKWSLRRVQELFHYGPVFVDEFQVWDMALTDVQRMEAFIDFCRLLEHHTLGERVSGAAMFVSNGLGNAYPPAFVVRDPAAYDALGAFIKEKQ